MNNTIHVYRQRHIFHGDNPIGKYHVPTRTIRLGTAHAAHGNAVKAHYLRNFGIVTKLLISDEELQRRLALWTAPEPPLKSGYWKLYVDHVLQADEGVDLDFLVGMRGAFVPKDNH